MQKQHSKRNLAFDFRIERSETEKEQSALRVVLRASMKGLELPSWKPMIRDIIRRFAFTERSSWLLWVGVSDWKHQRVLLKSARISKSLQPRQSGANWTSLVFRLVPFPIYCSPPILKYIFRPSLFEISYASGLHNWSINLVTHTRRLLFRK